MRVGYGTRGVPSEVYYPSQRALVGALLAKSVTVLACDPDDERHVYGCVVVADHDCAHWLYTKGAFRRMGIARSLRDHVFGVDAIVDATQSTLMIARANSTPRPPVAAAASEADTVVQAMPTIRARTTRPMPAAAQRK